MLTKEQPASENAKAPPSIKVVAPGLNATGETPTTRDTGSDPLPNKWMLPSSSLGLIIACLWAPLLLPQGPSGLNVTSARVLLTLLWIACPHGMVITSSFLIVSIWFRLTQQLSYFSDLHFINVHGLSSILTGNSLYGVPKLLGTSWAMYLPQGSFYGAIPIFFGLDRYWNFYHVINPILYLLPFLMTGSWRLLGAGILLCSYTPLSDYTSGGGNIEIHAALAFFTFTLLRNKEYFLALPAIAYLCNLRQPSLFLLPFIALLFYRHGKKRELVLLGLLLTVMGGIYVISHPIEFYSVAFKQHEIGAATWLKRAGGDLSNNHTLATALTFIGASFDTVWNNLRPFYLNLTLLGGFLLFVRAYKSKNDDNLLACAMLTTPLIYILSRGWTHGHYIAFALLPLFIFLEDSPSATSQRPWSRTGRFFAGVMSVVFLLLGSLPAVLGLFPLHSAYAKVENYTPIESVVRLDTKEPLQPYITSNRTTDQYTLLPLATGVDITLSEATKLHILEISGVNNTDEKGAPLREAPEGFPNLRGGETMYGFPRSLELQGSTDGLTFFTIKTFTNLPNHSINPVQLRINKNTPPIKILRLNVKSTYLKHPQWALSGVRVYGEEE